MDAGAQEAAFLYRRGDPHATFDRSLHSRIANVQTGETPGAVSFRANQYTRASEVIGECLRTFEAQHLQNTAEAVNKYISDSEAHSGGDGRLPTSLVLNCEDLVPSLLSRWHGVVIRSKECTNAKAAAKLIANRFTGGDTVVDADRRLIYDFDVLVQWASETNVEHLVVFVDDTDSFSAEILQSLVDLMHSYLDRLPFHLVLNLSMPPILLEDNKFTRENVAAMASRYFSGAPSVPDFVQVCLQELGSSKVWTTPELRQFANSRRSAAEAARILRYACLAHYTGSPFGSIQVAEDLSTHHLELLRRQTKTGDWIQKQTSKALQGQHNELSGIIHVGSSELNAVFDPTYRPLIEAVLVEPRILIHDGKRDRIPICVLYQLYRESSVYINLYDYYTAFEGALKAYGEEWGRQSMALFLDGIAQLKSIGLLRDCKRKFECVEKVSWKDV